MGAYRSRPETQKDTAEGQNGRLRFAATSMQGWRVSQEDAHNSLENFTDEWSLFAVYDGHGGSEVSQYTAQELPELIRKSQFEKTDDATAVLQDVFINFDDHLRSQAGIEKMEHIIKAASQENTNQSEDGKFSNELQGVMDEAKMPLQELLSRYGLAILKQPSSMKKKKGALIQEIDEQDTAVAEQEDKSTASTKRSTSPLGNEVKRAKLETGDASDPKQEEEDHKDKETEDQAPDDGKKDEQQAELPDDEKADVTTSDDTSDEDFEDESDEDEELIDEDLDESEEEEEATGDETRRAVHGSPEPDGQKPGEDSGTTACVCLVSKDKAIVANIGDSRAVLCRSGVAIDLSSDHKPEDDVEKERILAAGGMITAEGRVCGGLNLSRALGDHYYKKTDAIPLARQMISALPDVKTQDLTPEDEFIVVACDGIWNSKGSQEVVDFIRQQVQLKKPLKEIAEALCDSCLAENSGGDGTGCDNMTAIIVDLRRPIAEDPVKETKDELTSEMDD